MEEQKQKALSILKDSARNRRTIYYGEIYEVLGLDSNNIADRNKGSDILGKVNEITMNDNNIMISALVVSREANKPYDGFFKLAVDIGKIDENINEFEKTQFWVEEVKRIFDIYKNI